MAAFRLSTLRRYSTRWLLALALLSSLLPLAQTAAAWHAYGHVASDARSEGDLAPHAAPCELCLAAAALGSGAVAGQPPALLPAGAAPLPPLPVQERAAAAPAALAYRSRAPPLSSC